MGCTRQSFPGHTKATSRPMTMQLSGDYEVFSGQLSNLLENPASPWPAAVLGCAGLPAATSCTS